MTTDTLIDALSGYVDTRSDGTVVYRNAVGQTHRIDGPAIEWSDGEEEWWLNGVRYSEQEFHEQLKSLGHTPCPLM